MPLTFEDPKDYVESKEKLYLKAIVYAKSGGGKTFLSVANVLPSIHPGYKTLVISMEKQGKITIKEAKKKGLVHKETRVVSISTLEELREMVDYLYKNPDHGYELIVLDTIDEIQELVKKNRLALKKGKLVLTIQDWMILKDKIRSVVTAFRDLPVHFLGLVHSSDIFTEEDGRWTSLSFAGKNQDDVIAGLVNLVGYLYKSIDKDGVVERRVIFNGDTSYLTKEINCVKNREEPWFPLWVAKFDEQIPKEASTREWIDLLKEQKSIKKEASKNKQNEEKKPAPAKPAPAKPALKKETKKGAVKATKTKREKSPTGKTK